MGFLGLPPVDYVYTALNAQMDAAKLASLSDPNSVYDMLGIMQVDPNTSVLGGGGISTLDGGSIPFMQLQYNPNNPMRLQYNPMQYMGEKDGLNIYQLVSMFGQEPGVTPEGYQAKLPGMTYYLQNPDGSLTKRTDPSSSRSWFQDVLSNITDTLSEAGSDFAKTMSPVMHYAIPAITIGGAGAVFGNVVGGLAGLAAGGGAVAGGVGGASTGGVAGGTAGTAGTAGAVSMYAPEVAALLSKVGTAAGSGLYAGINTAGIQQVKTGSVDWGDVGLNALVAAGGSGAVNALTQGLSPTIANYTSPYITESGGKILGDTVSGGVKGAIASTPSAIREGSFDPIWKGAGYGAAGAGLLSGIGVLTGKSNTTHKPTVSNDESSTDGLLKYTGKIVPTAVDLLLGYLSSRTNNGGATPYAPTTQGQNPFYNRLTGLLSSSPTSAYQTTDNINNTPSFTKTDLPTLSTYGDNKEKQIAEVLSNPYKNYTLNDYLLYKQDPDKIQDILARYT